MGKKTSEVSDFYCTQCGKKGIPVIRKNGQFREKGHLKKLYCCYCKEETNHVEVRPFGKYTYDNFLEEYNLGRFLENGTRIAAAELMKCSKKDCQYNKNGSCWNSNDSKVCKHKIR